MTVTVKGLLALHILVLLAPSMADRSTSSKEGEAAWKPQKPLFTSSAITSGWSECPQITYNNGIAMPSTF